MGYSIEYTVEQLDWPIDVSQPWLGYIPTVMEAVVTIEGDEDQWVVTGINIKTTLDKEACFTRIKRHYWATYSPIICSHVQAMLAADILDAERIAEEFADRRDTEREFAEEFRSCRMSIMDGDATHNMGALAKRSGE